MKKLITLLLIILFSMVCFGADALLIRVYCDVSDISNVTDKESQCINDGIIEEMKSQDFSKYFESTEIYIVLRYSKRVLLTSYTVKDIADVLNNEFK